MPRKVGKRRNKKRKSGFVEKVLQAIDQQTTDALKAEHDRIQKEVEQKQGGVQKRMSWATKRLKQANIANVQIRSEEENKARRNKIPNYELAQINKLAARIEQENHARAEILLQPPASSALFAKISKLEEKQKGDDEDVQTSSSSSSSSSSITTEIKKEEEDEDEVDSSSAGARFLKENKGNNKSRNKRKRPDHNNSSDEPPKKKDTFVKLNKSAKERLYDIWGNAAEEAKAQEIQGELYTYADVKEIANPSIKSKTMTSLTTRIPAVPAPSHSESYRPDTTAWKDANKEFSKQQKIEAKQYDDVNQFMRNLSKNKKYLLPVDNRKFKEEEEEAVVHLATSKKPKTLLERKSKAAHNARERALEDSRKKARQERDIYRIPDIMEQIEAQTEAIHEKQELKKKQDEDSRLRPTIIGNYKPRQAIFPIVGRNSEGQRMRQFKTTVNPITERLQSMRNRGVISARKGRLGQTRKIKKVETQGIRDYMLEEYHKYMAFPSE